MFRGLVNHRTPLHTEKQGNVVHGVLNHTCTHSTPLPCDYLAPNSWSEAGCLQGCRVHVSLVALQRGVKPGVFRGGIAL